MLDFDILSITIGIVILTISLIYMKYKMKFENEYLLFYSIFFIYLLGVLKYTIFPIPLDPFMAEVMSKETTFLDGINIIPFNFKSVNYLMHRQVFLNIILSMPFGFGISYITKITKNKLLILSGLFGITIEGIQLLISLILGFTYRYIDINDVILNFIGVLIGYYIFKIFSMIFIRIIKKNKIELNSILKYIYRIAEETT